MNFSHPIAKISLTIILLPLLYMSIARFAGQFMVSTDNSSLFRTDLTNALFNPVIPDLTKDPASSASSKFPSIFATVLSLDPFNGDYWYLAALDTIKTDVQTAENQIQHAIGASMIDPKNWVLRGWIEGKRGFIDQGRQFLDTAIMLSPMRASSHAQQGIYLYQMWLNADASKKDLYEMPATLSLIKALELDKNLYLNPYVNTALAELYMTDKSQPYATSVLTVIPNDQFIGWPMTIKRLALFFELRDAVKALTMWRKQFNPKKLSPEDLQVIEAEIGKYRAPELAYPLAQIHVAQGKFSEALKELTSLVSARAESAEYKIALASVHEHMGNRAVAGRLYEEALRLSPANQEAKGKVIEYYGRDGR
jgi:tetratricopeptide (TPR) repeat protein